MSKAWIVAGFFLAASMWCCAGQVEWRCAAKKKEWLLGEPVVVSVAFRNVGSTACEVPDHLEMDNTGTTRYEISSDGATFAGIETFEMMDPVRRTVSLQPGHEYSHDQVIMLDGRTRQTPFASNGVYYVRALVPLLGEDVYSSVATVRVVGVNSDVCKVASVLFLSAEVAQYVTPWCGSKLGPEVRSRLSSVAEQRSEFAPYAAVFLCEKELSADIEAALRWAEKADVDEFVLRDRAVYLKGVACLRLLQIDKAQAQFDRIEKEFPYSAAACILKRDGERMMSEAKSALAGRVRKRRRSMRPRAGGAPR
jgi:hypothetical protein